VSRTPVYAVVGDTPCWKTSVRVTGVVLAEELASRGAGVMPEVPWAAPAIASQARSVSANKSVGAKVTDHFFIVYLACLPDRDQSPLKRPKDQRQMKVVAANQRRCR